MTKRELKLSEAMNRDEKPLFERRKRKSMATARRKAAYAKLVLSSIPVKDLSTSEQIALVQMIEVAQKKRPQIDGTLSITPNVRLAYHKYSRLPQPKKRTIGNILTSAIAGAVLNAANSDDGVVAYKKLLEGSLKSG